MQLTAQFWNSRSFFEHMREMDVFPKIFGQSRDIVGERVPEQHIMGRNCPLRGDSLIALSCWNLGV